jgi:decaprenylphospho-beta-D-erythro-pentofuranosid-2-ulose 2-reductase
MGFILVIGANSDIAKATTKEYIKNGYDIYLTGRDINALNLFADDLRSFSSQKVIVKELDILNYSTHEEFYASLNEKPIGVITAVGYLGDQEKASQDFIESEKIINTNFTGLVSLLNIISNDFRKQRQGFIIGISSVAGDRGRKSNYIYGSAKGAFTLYLSGLRNMLYSSNIHVMTVKPGFVNTQMTKDMMFPKILVSEPENLAKKIYKAQQKGKNILHSKLLWIILMAVILLIPESYFKKTNI